MDHSENDKRFYVYLHKDEHGDVVYVGSGSGRRWKRVSGRTKEHLEVFDKLHKEIVKYGLSKQESLEYEIEMYDKYVSNGKLINKRRPYFVRELDHEELSKFVYYDPTSSSGLRWKIDRYAGENYLMCKYPKDSLAGCKNKNGYYCVSIEKKQYLAHRVIWSIVNKQNIATGLVIDHIDGNPSNNLIENLRAATFSQNSRNREGTGKVSWSEEEQTWKVRTQHNNKVYNKHFPPRLFSKEGSDPKQQAYQLAEEYLQLILEDRYESQRRFEIDKTLEILQVEYFKNRQLTSQSHYKIQFEQIGNSYRYRVRYKVGGKTVAKNFTCRQIFPDLPIQQAIEETLKLAMAFRDSVITN